MNFPKYPYQPFDEPIPPPPLDKGEVCLSIDRKWKPYLVGLLKTLLIDRTWETDELRATGEASLLLEEILLADDCPIEPVGGEGDDCMGCCIRVENGVIQTLNCGVWTDVPGGDIKKIAAGTGQPAQGTPQPGPGECMEFSGRVDWGGRWLLPVPVSSGDKIRVTSCGGATTDYALTELLWRCGDGDIFLANVCISGTEILDPLAPAPTFPQQALIGFDGVNYYNFADAANLVPVEITIPAGITNANFVFLINDEVTFGAGDLSFNMSICKANPNVERFTHTFDLRVSMGPLVLRMDGTAPLVSWIPGVGAQVHNPSAILGQGVLQIGMVLPRTLHNCVIRLVANVGTDPLVNHGICNIPHAPIFTTAATECQHDTTSPNLDFTVALAADVPVFLVNADAENAGDTNTITVIEISADGSDPF